MLSKAELNRFETYLIEEELSKNTIKNYLFSVRKFFESYPKLTKANAIAWKAQLMKEVSPKTVNIRLNGLTRYAEYKEIFLKIKHIKIHKTVCTENVITREQFHYLMDCLKKDGQEQWYINILVLAKTGARISEALKLTKADALRGYVDLYTKTKVRRIYIPAILTDQLAEYLSGMEDSDCLMHCNNSKNITRGGVAEALRRFAKKYDIPKNVMHPHAFRHLFAIEFLKSNGNITLLADVLGHSGVNTTMIYTRLSGEEQKRQIDKAVNW